MDVTHVTLRLDTGDAASGATRLEWYRGETGCGWHRCEWVFTMNLVRDLRRILGTVVLCGRFMELGEDSRFVDRILFIRVDGA